VIAIDPDIPAAHQRIALVSDDSRAAQRWVLNGQDLGPVTAPVLWQPVPGKHTLSLVDDARRVLDAVSFEVRPLLTTNDLPLPQAR
jgi:hypothetical protein